ncbi:uncharacterized protein G2W53_037812 [Senna tora]|uniref:Uncharacterized protein n=1 Tax=Senna tora TaxID=362788 RepID=A0A834SLC2_9FABA|nr:uncharacterized protein G2W53_037812 [Senna tora]
MGIAPAQTTPKSGGSNFEKVRLEPYPPNTKIHKIGIRKAENEFSPSDSKERRSNLPHHRSEPIPFHQSDLSSVFL